MSLMMPGTRTRKLPACTTNATTSQKHITLRALALMTPLLVLLLVTGAEAAAADATFNVSGTFGDDNSTPLTGTLTINTTTGSIDGFYFNIPTMTIVGRTLPGALFTPQTATAGFFNDPDPSLGTYITLQLTGSPPLSWVLYLLIPQTTLVSYTGGSLLNSITVQGQIYQSGYQNGADLNLFINLSGNGVITPLVGIDLRKQPSDWTALLTMLTDVNGTQDSATPPNPLGPPQFVIAEAYAGSGGTMIPANAILTTYQNAVQAMGGNPLMGAYVYMGFCPNCAYPTDTGADQVARALEQVCVPGVTSCPLVESLGFLAIDVECVDSGGGNQCGNWTAKPTNKQALAGNSQTIYQAVQTVQAAGLKPVIYTELRSWGALTAGNEAAVGISSFGCIPLWTDQPQDDIAELSNAPPSPFGGWPQAIGKQYQTGNGSGVPEPGGVTVDLDVFGGLSYFTPPPPGISFAGTPINYCAANPTACMAQDVTLSQWGNPASAVEVIPGPQEFNVHVNPVTDKQTFTLVNTTADTIPGPLWLVFDNLTFATNNLTVNGFAALPTTCTYPAGSPALIVSSGGLAPRASVSVHVQFPLITGPIPTGPLFTNRVLSGNGRL